MCCLCLCKCLFVGAAEDVGSVPSEFVGHCCDGHQVDWQEPMRLVGWVGLFGFKEISSRIESWSSCSWQRTGGGLVGFVVEAFEGRGEFQAQIPK